jgi:hypothetical protein
MGKKQVYTRKGTDITRKGILKKLKDSIYFLQSGIGNMPEKTQKLGIWEIHE